MGPSPKENPSRNKIQSTQIMQQTYHHPVVRGCSRICSH